MFFYSLVIERVLYNTLIVLRGMRYMSKFKGHRLSITVHKELYDKLDRLRITHEDDNTKEAWEYFLDRIIDEYLQCKGKERGGKDNEP